MARRTLTEDQKTARADKVAALGQAAAALAEDRPTDIDLAAAILSGYSRRNVALILIQAEQVGRGVPQAVAGFHDWRKAGRQVRKGSHGYMIFRPRIIKDKATGEESRTGYAITYVFDVADTDPISAGDAATLSAALAE